MPRKRALHLDPKHPLGRGPAEGPLGILDIVQDSQAAPIIGLAVERRPNRAGRPLEQQDAQPVLQLADHLRRG